MFNYIRQNIECINGVNNVDQCVFIDSPGASGKSYFSNSIMAWHNIAHVFQSTLAPLTFEK